MKNIKYKFHLKWLIIVLILTAGLSSCLDDLEKLPTNDITAEIQFNSVSGYKQSMVSIFSNLAYGQFLRHYWGMQEFTTDEAVSTWNDGGIYVYHQLSWSADVPAINFVYSTALNTITYCNNFINESADEKITQRGFNADEATQIRRLKAEVKFLRAYSFWILMDLYGNPPFPTEKSLGFSAPMQIQRKDLFAFIESELKAIEPYLAEPRTNEWGRPDKAAAWALLSRLYLNGKVYTGEEYFTEAITYCKNIIAAGYALEDQYSWLMLADNHLNKNEFIFTINFDNTNQTWVGTNFLVLGPAGVPASINGLSGSWNTHRFTQQIPVLFPTADTTVDKRAMFYTVGQKLNVDDVTIRSDGYSSYKYRNINRDGSAVVQNNTFKNLSDVDFPVFRLAEIYLSYAEAVLRGGTGGELNLALSYINKLRGRAYANDPLSTMGNIPISQLNLDFILDEKAREMYWEAQRRTDLVRHNKLTTANYLWAWKGNTMEGRAVDEKYNLFPIPTADLLANPNLKQLLNY
jgi:hypothetical protein